MQTQNTKQQFIQNLFNQQTTLSTHTELAASLLDLTIKSIFTENAKNQKDLIGRILYEIIQNADDSVKEGTKGKLTITMLDDYIVFQHTGSSFDEEDIKALCSVDKSTKTKDASKIGYKGIGFKSVFSISDWVYIYSDEYSFVFSKEEYQNYVSKTENKYPWQIAPIWQEKQDLPQELQELRSDENVFIAIKINLKEAQTNENVRRYFGDIFWESPVTMLFFNGLSEIKIDNLIQNTSFFAEITQDEVEMLTKIYTKIDSIDKQGKPKERKYDFFVHKEVFFIEEEVQIQLKANSDYPHKLKNAAYTRIIFAFLSKGTLPTEKFQHLYAYLPINDTKISCPYLVNADFNTFLDRSKLQPNDFWNHYLFEKIAYYQIKWIGKLMQNNYGEHKKIAQNFKKAYASLNKDYSYQSHFNKGLNAGLTNFGILPDREGVLRKASDLILIDENAGLSKLDLGKEICDWVENTQQKTIIFPFAKDVLQEIKNWELSELVVLDKGLLMRWVEANPILLSNDYFNYLKPYIEELDGKKILNLFSQTQTNISDDIWLNFLSLIKNKKISTLGNDDILIPTESGGYELASKVCLLGNSAIKELGHFSIKEKKYFIKNIPQDLLKDETIKIFSKLGVDVINEIEITSTPKTNEAKCENPSKWKTGVTDILPYIAWEENASDWENLKIEYLKKINKITFLVVENLSKEYKITTKKYDELLLKTEENIPIFYDLEGVLLNNNCLSDSKMEIILEIANMIAKVLELKVTTPEDLNRYLSWGKQKLAQKFAKDSPSFPCELKPETDPIGGTSITNESKEKYCPTLVEIGEIGERHVFNCLKKDLKGKYPNLKYAEGQDKAIVSENETLVWHKGENKGYDISLQINGEISHYYEVKTTAKSENNVKALYLPKSEYEIWKANKEIYTILWVEYDTPSKQCYGEPKKVEKYETFEASEDIEFVLIVS